MTIIGSGSRSSKTRTHVVSALLAALLLFSAERTTASERGPLLHDYEASSLLPLLPAPHGRMHSTWRLIREASADSAVVGVSGSASADAASAAGDGAAVSGDTSADAGDTGISGVSQVTQPPAAGTGGDTAIAADDHSGHDAATADTSSSPSGSAADTTAAPSEGNQAHHQMPSSEPGDVPTPDTLGSSNGGSNNEPADATGATGSETAGSSSNHENQQDPQHTGADADGSGKVAETPTEVAIPPPPLPLPSLPPRVDVPPKPTVSVAKTVFYSKTFDKENRCLYCNGELCRGIDRSMPSVCFTTGPCWVSKTFDTYGEFVRITNQSLGCSPTLTPPNGFDCRSGTATACTLTGNTCLCCCNGELCNGDDYCDRLLASSSGAPTVAPLQPLLRLWLGTGRGGVVLAVAALLASATGTLLA